MELVEVDSSVTEGNPLVVEVTSVDEPDVEIMPVTLDEGGKVLVVYVVGSKLLLEVKPSAVVLLPTVAELVVELDDTSLMRKTGVAHDPGSVYAVIKLKVSIQKPTAPCSCASLPTKNQV